MFKKILVSSLVAGLATAGIAAYAQNFDTENFNLKEYIEALKLNGDFNTFESMLIEKK